MRLLIGFLFLFNALFALEPIAKLDLKGSAIDLIAKDDLIVSGGDAGAVEIFKNHKPFKSFQLADVENAFGKAPPKIYSLDLMDEKLLVVSEGNALEGRTLAIYSFAGDLISELISAKKRDLIRKARFVANNQIFIMEVGGTARLLDLAGHEIYSKEILGSSFSDFALNASKTKAAIASEAGDVKVVDIASGKVEKSLTGGSKDNIYKISWQEDLIATSGQDRIVAIFSSTGVRQIHSDFLVSAVALSRSKIAYVKDESGSIAVVDLAKDSEVATLSGHFAMVSNIVFTNESDLITGGDDRFLLLWRIK